MVARRASATGASMLKQLTVIIGLTSSLFAAAADLDLLYINRCVGGCDLTPGPDNAIDRVSSIINQATTIPAFPHGDEAFNATVSCVRTVLARYDVTIVTTDPGAVARREVILGGNSAAVGLPPNTWGVAPWANGTPIDNVIAFAFAADIGSSVDNLCWFAAQQFGTLYGLDHEYYCPDINSYLSGCGTKSFTNFDASCGEFSARACQTSGNPPTQNAAARLAVAPGNSIVIFRDYFEPAGPSP